MNTRKKIKVVRALSILIVGVCLSYGGKKIVVPHDFPTIHSALGEADEGDTIYVSKGVYYENIALTDNVVLQGQDMIGTVIDGRRLGPCIIGADGALITNLTIRNGTVGVLCKNTRPTIERNFIVDNKETGIHALIALPNINNNIIFRNGWTGIFLESSRGTRTTIEHNVILENGYCGIYGANHTEVLVRNNILMKNKQFGIFVEPDAKKTRIINNNIFNNRSPFNSIAVIHQSNINKEPVFISEGHPEYNYFVKAVSPLKGAGENGTDIGLITEQMIEAFTTDKDGDGIPDDVDLCPDIAEDKDGFEDIDGCPDYDNDKDGIYDAQDQCPNEPEDKDGFQDVDGCPDLDNDRDGIPDISDACPNNPETVNGFKDDDGCPDEKPQEIKQTLILQGVNFKTASAELLDESYYVLEQVYNSLEAYPNVRIEIGGHTDDQGSNDYNLALSYDRAKSVMEYFVMRGIDSGRIVARGYGEEKPMATNSSAEGRAKNRRVEVVPLR